MYIHIGENQVVSSDKIVMIFDYKGSTSVIMQDFMERQKERFVQLTSGEIKSMIVTEKEIYLSPLATSTLKKRAKSLYI